MSSYFKKITNKASVNKFKKVDAGNIYYDLIFEPKDWVKRVNESLILDTSKKTTNRRVTLDLEIPKDLPAHNEIVSSEFILNTNFPIAKSENQIAIPVGVLSKEPILKFDITHDGKSIQNLTSYENGKYTLIALKWFVIDFYNKIKEEYEETEFILQDLLEISQMAVAYDGALREIEIKKSDSIKMIEKLKDKNEKKFIKEINSKIDLIENVLHLEKYEKNSSYRTEIEEYFKKFKSLINIVSFNFIIFALLPGKVQGKRITVKYSILNPDVSGGNEKSNPSQINYNLLKFWKYTTYHIYIELPEGIQLVSSAKHKKRFDYIKEEGNFYKELSGPETSDNLEWKDYSYYRTEFYAIPEKAGIRNFSFYSTICVLFFMLTFIPYIHSQDFLNANSPRVSIPVAILVSSASLFLAWLAKNTEHKLYSETVLPLRKNLAFLSLVLAITTLAISVPLSPLTAKILWSIIYLILLIVSCHRFLLWHNHYYFPDKSIS